METITIEKKGFTQIRIIIESECEFLNEPLIMKLTHESISFKKPSFDYNGKTNKLQRKSNKFQTSISIELKEQTIEFDKEESTEDYLIAYF